MKFWKDRDGLSTHSALWNKQLDLMISKWVTRINPLSSDYQEFSCQLDELRQYDTALCEPAQLTLLHCDYIGRNILVGNDNRISGVIDFEAARIGDPIYDLAKIVWVNMDFSELDLRNAVLEGWESTYKQTVPKRKFYTMSAFNALPQLLGRIHIVLLMVLILFFALQRFGH